MRVPGNKYRVVVSTGGRQVGATCRLDGNVDGATLYYPRYTRLGAALLANARSEREVVANYIRQEMGWRRGTNGGTTPISFVSV